MTRFQIPSLVAAFAAPIFFSFNAHALVIMPTFDSSIASDPNAAEIENTINTAIRIYQSNFSDAVTVKILFKEMSSGLGQSLTYYNDVLYASFYSALQARATTANDTTALAHLPSGASNPVNGHSVIRSTLAHLRALGFPNMNLPAGYYDSTISINVSLCNLDRVTIDPNKYDLLAVALHEIDEVLGTSSALSSESECRVVDLFRYNSTGARSYTAGGDDAYFSLDGVTRLARYNQNSSGDYGDWWSAGAHTPQVQDAFGTRGATPNLGVELTVLDAIGWKPISTASVLADLAIQSITRNGNTLTLAWSAAAGENYQVQYTTDLNQPAWNNLGVPIAATGSTASVSDTIGADPQRFYRVELLPGSAGMGTGVSTTGDGLVDVRTLKHELREFHREGMGR